MSLLENIFSFGLNILFWYGFTILSTIFSKKYLNLTNDSHTLSLVTFFYPFFLKLLRTCKKNESLVKVVKLRNYYYLALFNVGTIALTNIGINETSVSLTYMVKVFFLISQFDYTALIYGCIYSSSFPIQTAKKSYYFWFLSVLNSLDILQAILSKMIYDMIYYLQK